MPSEVLIALLIVIEAVSLAALSVIDGGVGFVAVLGGMAAANLMLVLLNPISKRRYRWPEDFLLVAAMAPPIILVIVMSDTFGWIP